jgi:hypothetical protein
MTQEPMTQEQIVEWELKIDAMDHEAMARLWRFAPAGHPIFRHDLPLFAYFKAKFDALGGMTPGLSKKIGW